MKRPGQEAAKRLNINWGSFYRNVFALVIPMAIQNLINVGVTAADVIMLGRVGEKVLSGASLAGQIQFIMTLIFMGITSGATVLTAQYWGKKDTRTIEKVLGMGLAAGLITAVAFAAAALFIPEALMRIYSSDPAVIAEGIRYLRIVGFSYLFMAVTQVYLNIMRSIERVLIATFVYSISLIVNIAVNALLIFGNPRRCYRNAVRQNRGDGHRAVLCILSEPGGAYQDRGYGACGQGAFKGLYGVRDAGGPQ